MVPAWHRHACALVGPADADQVLPDFPDTAGVAVGEPEPLVDRRAANLDVLQHLAVHRVG
jgi:hypothetical protein